MADNSSKSGAQPSDEVRKEQTKLTANFFNMIAGGLIATGAVTPTIAVTSMTNAPLYAIAEISIACLAGAAICHVLARLHLKRLGT